MSSATSSSFPSRSPIRPAPRSGPRSSSAQTPTSSVDAISSFFGEVTIGDWQKAGLLQPSVTKPILATVEKGLVIRKLGQLQDADRKALERALGLILG